MPTDTERQIGILIGEVRAMNARLDRADESRKELHTGVATLTNSVQNLDSKMQTLADDVAEMKPEFALVRGIKGKAATAIIVIGAIGGAIAWVVSNFWHVIFPRG